MEQTNRPAEHKTTQLVPTFCNQGTTRSIAVQTEPSTEDTYRGASGADVQVESDPIFVPATLGANGAAPLHTLESPPTSLVLSSAAAFLPPAATDDDFTPPPSSLKKRRARQATKPSYTPSKFEISRPRKGILQSPRTACSHTSVHFSPKDYSTLFRKDQVLDMELFEKRKKLGLDLGPDPGIRLFGRTKARIRRGGWAEGRRLQRKAEEEGVSDEEEVSSEMTAQEAWDGGEVNVEDEERQEEAAGTDEEKMWAAQVSFTILGLEETRKKP